MLYLRLFFKKAGSILAFTFLLTACGNAIKIDGFDTQKWIDSSQACNNYRADKAPLILNNKEKLLAKTQNEIERLLGKAEEHELYTRNQKFFHYRISQPNNCSETNNPEYLSVRFNAIGRAQEVQMVIREN